MGTEQAGVIMGESIKQTPVIPAQRTKGDRFKDSSVLLPPYFSMPFKSAEPGSLARSARTE